MEEYIAYKGYKYTIEWYYTERGDSNKIIITNAFVKKAQKLRKQEKDRAIAARNDYIERVREGKYYEE